MATSIIKVSEKKCRVFLSFATMLLTMWTMLSVQYSHIMYNYINTVPSVTNLKELSIVDAPTEDNASSKSFPPDCTWQCYLRQNNDLFQTIPWNKELALQHYISTGYEEKRNCACKIVIIAAPHKAASSTLQYIATQYSAMENVQWKWLGKRSPKAFAPFVMSLRGDKSYEKMRGLATELFNETETKMKKVDTIDKTERNDTNLFEFDTVKNMYQNELHSLYKEGFNILLGSELLDEVTHPNRSTLLDEVLSILPPNVIEYKDQHVKSLVVYRNDRARHLKSLWIQYLIALYLQLLKLDEIPNSKESSFIKFGCNILKKTFPHLDSLGLVNALLNKGLKVDLVSMSVVKEEATIDFFNILGCDLMGLTCIHDQERNLLVPKAILNHNDGDSILKRMTDPVNTKNYTEYTKFFDASDDQMLEIDNVIEMYDCAEYRRIVENYDNNQFKVLYNSSFIEKFNKCGKQIVTRNQLHKSFDEILGCDNIGYQLDDNLAEVNIKSKI